MIKIIIIQILIIMIIIITGTNLLDAAMSIFVLQLHFLILNKIR